MTIFFAVNIIGTTTFIQYIKNETGLLGWICGQVICLMCASGKFICALFVVYGAGRQTGWKTTNHGNQPWLQPNDRLQLKSKPKTVICISSPFFSWVEITVESDVMQCLNPQFIHYDPYRKGQNNNPVALQLALWKTSCFLTVWSVSFSQSPSLDLDGNLLVSRLPTKKWFCT